MRITPLYPALLAAAALGTAGVQIAYYEEALPSTMNPLFARTMVDRRAHELVFDRLYYRSAVTSEIKSRLIETATPLEGGLKIDLVLKQGIKWHDGTDFTAEDVVFTYNLYLNGPANRWTHHVSDVPRIEKITAVSPTRVRFEAPRPMPNFDNSISDLRRDVIDGHLHRDHDLEALQVAFSAVSRGYQIFRERYAARLDVPVDQLDRRVASVVETWLASMAQAPRP